MTLIAKELLDFFMVANDETRRNVTGLMKVKSASVKLRPLCPQCRRRSAAQSGSGTTPWSLGYWSTCRYVCSCTCTCGCTCSCSCSCNCSCSCSCTCTCTSTCPQSDKKIKTLTDTAELIEDAVHAATVEQSSEMLNSILKWNHNNKIRKLTTKNKVMRYIYGSQCLNFKVSGKNQKE